MGTQRLIRVDLLLDVRAVSLAQVDAPWLRAWEESWASRPTELSASSNIAKADEPGVTLVIRGAHRRSKASLQTMGFGLNLTEPPISQAPVWYSWCSEGMPKKLGVQG